MIVPRSLHARCLVALVLYIFVALASSSPLSLKPRIASLFLNSFFSKKPPDSTQLVECLNEAFDEDIATSWKRAMDSKFKNEASLYAAGAWWSKKQPPVPLTIVTQLSSNRISQLWAQCQTFPGTISAAIHLGLYQEQSKPLSLRNNANLKKAQRNLSEFHQMVERNNSACILDILLVYEIYSEKRAMLLYPVNQLRNLARVQARTELIALMDVDMLLSSKLPKWMSEEGNVELMTRTCARRQVYVTPAFETYRKSGAVTSTTREIEIADQLSKQSKSYLIRSIKTGFIGPFDSIRFPIGHNTTDFPRWYTAQEQYTVPYTERYEPWIIASRSLIPWHDVRFRGYGQNKIVHIAHANASGFKFVIHPTAFIIHRPHEVTQSRKQLIADKKEYSKAQRMNRTLPSSTIYGRSTRLWEISKQQMDQGFFDPTLDSGTINCRNKLSWWQ